MIVKNLNFGGTAREQVFKGIEKLTNAVSSTLGASGKCVILEDANGNPIITKDGVTVADSIVLLNPVENMGATLIKEAARKTVREAGDGTTTATILAHAILKEAYAHLDKSNTRVIKEGILSATNNKIFWIPEGFAHGFLSLEDDTIFSYKCTNFYNKESERTILWNDSKLNIDWSIKSSPFISEKDLTGESFDTFQSKFV